MNTATSTDCGKPSCKLLLNFINRRPRIGHAPPRGRGLLKQTVANSLFLSAFELAGLNCMIIFAKKMTNCVRIDKKLRLIE